MSRKSWGPWEYLPSNGVNLSSVLVRVLQRNRTKMACVYVQEEINDKQLFHAILDADKSQDL